MSWSVGEAGALALKAARGAGMTWGQAEEAGFAVRWLQQRNVPGIAALSVYLAQYDPHKMDKFSCPINIGCAISDMALTPPSNLGRVHTPVLLLPFIAAIAIDTSVRLRIGGVTIDVFNHDFESGAAISNMQRTKGECHLELGDSTNFIANGQCAMRVPDTAKDAMAVLEQFAQRTYAPSTEESRLSGAGADADVND